jgi:acetoin utilization protein AcuB
MPIVGVVMTSFPFFVGIEESVLELEKIMDEHVIRHLPVQDKGKLVGVVSERDLHHRVKRTAPAEEKERLRARDVMVADPYVVSFNTPLNEVLAQMERRRIGAALVVRRGKLAGILSTMDVCRVFGEFLESWFGAPAHGNDAA